MSKGRKLWLQPGFIANQVVPDYERERNERVKRNNEVLNSLGLKSIATSLWGSAQHKRANDNGKHSKDELDDDYRPPNVENVHAYDSDIDLSLPKRSKSESSPSALVYESNIRTKRGITRLSDIWNLPPGKKVVVDFNATCLPVGEEGGVFNRFIGTVARKPHLCPINCKSWHFVPNHYKEDCWSIIESKFFIPDNERDLIKHNTLKSLGEKLRAWRCSLKAKYYDESKTAAQVVATAPATVNQEQYADLVSYWYSTDGQVLSIANKSRRKEKNNPHTAGSKTYAQHAYELEKREEVGVSRTMLYEPTHTKKDGKTPVSDKAAENMRKMKDLMASQPSTPEENTKGKINWSKNDIYSQVMDEKEHGGRFRGLGFGHTSKTCGSTSNSDARLRVASNEERIREKDNYIVVLEDKLNSAVSELNTVKSVVEFLARQSGFQVQDIANGILNQVSPRANQGSSFASHEIEAPLGPSTTVGVVQIGLKQLGSAQF
ncbi:hypothetical protein RHGRI_016736 [Rhododendron griersonianum]|uniref:Transposase n=2 Tax=Rhododendron griersonianum TaxID=479676 RepID=A0AAV6JV69_9ERIC|nr:hypothetical protein RHGRI_016736 [Rhododendron griersonianum]